MQTGEWKLYFIKLIDKVGNERTYREEDLGKEYRFKLIDGETDLTPPIIKDMIWSSNELKIGETLEVEIEAYDEESGIELGDYLKGSSIYIEHSDTKIYKGALLEYDETRKIYKAKFEITPDMQTGEWKLYFIKLIDKVGNERTYKEEDLEKEYRLKLNSVFTGVENKTIKVGTEFDALQGITGMNKIDGDFTNKITYKGHVNTEKEGIYLLKYQAEGESGYKYTDYCWISVVDNIVKDENGNEKIYFNNSVDINFLEESDSSNITVKKDGSILNLFNNTLEEEGRYEILFKESNVQRLNFDESDDEFDLSFIIDKTAPTIIEINQVELNEGETISPNKLITAEDNFSEVIYTFVEQPNWSKVGQQIVAIEISDLSGNKVKQQVEINVLDKCDIDKSGKVDILDLATISNNYNNDESDEIWNSRLDLNKDNIIDIFDLVICSNRIK